MLREIANGLSTIDGGRVDSLLALMGAGMATGIQCPQSEKPVFIQVHLTSSGAAYLHEARTSVGWGGRSG